jgi:4'-phosphopantetheinyl transferase EntD
LVSHDQEAELTAFDQQEAATISAKLSVLATSAHPHLLVGCRAVQVNDEFTLSPTEVASFKNAIAEVRRRSGSARMIARSMLRRFGCPSLELPRTSSGAPRWPQGFVGSLSHDSEYAVAAVAPRGLVHSVGIDIEPSLPLPRELLDLVTNPAERIRLNGDLLSARLLFSVKEAVFKATYPLDEQLLDFFDVEVDLDRLVAETSTGRRLRILAVKQPRILSLTVILS